MDYAKGWEVGDVVIIYSGSGHPIARTRIAKIYKTGHLIAGGTRFRPRGDVAHETGDGYTKKLLKRASPERVAEFEKYRKFRRVCRVGVWLSGLELDGSDRIPDALLERLEALREAIETATANQ